jgi:hypothetical protein
VGERLFFRILLRLGLQKEDVQDCWDERKAPQREFRRGLRYYAEALKALKIDVDSITTSERAEQAIVRALRWLRTEKKLSPGVVSKVRSAVCVMYSYKLEWKGTLSSSRVLNGVLKVMKRRNPKIKKDLDLDWELKDLLRYCRNQLPPDKLSWTELLNKCICMCRIFACLRYTEMEQMDAEATEPTTDGWEFVLMIKGKGELSVIKVWKNKELLIDPVRHLKEREDQGKEETRNSGV